MPDTLVSLDQFTALQQPHGRWASIVVCAATGAIVAVIPTARREDRPVA